MKRILITGGTGYLGTKIINDIIHKYEVACVILPNDSKSRHTTIRNDVEYITINEENYVKNITSFSPDMIIHLACMYESSDTHPNDIYQANLLFPLQLLEICSRIGIEQWINTDTALLPDVSMYALSKRQFSEWGKVFATKFNFGFTNLALEHFYAADAPKTQFISFLIDRLKSNKEINLTLGTQKRDFVFIDDVVNVYKFFLNKPMVGYNYVPVGTGISPSIREVVEYLKHIIGSTSKLNFGAIPARENEHESHCDISILNELGFGDFIYWKDGIKLIV